MGSIISQICEFFEKIWQYFFGTIEKRILIVGLDASGKTTTLYWLKEGVCASTIPTIGFNFETVRYKNTNFSIWDVGGLPEIQSLWRHYYQGTEGLIFVVDSYDKERLGEASDALFKVLSSEELIKVPLLVLANKQDLPNPIKVSEIVDKLNLHSIKDREWFIQATSGITGEGLFEGLEWLRTVLNS
ncbi:unnamed protein product [Blepharisma stoltei]|uniref:ADP-ribosylation factor n=1 Tax=Blepharisma stoltei TaxID=1481888 RepID=A0AAU9IYI4_9CILI|nr:unnamed protein product [Blepharisma stoltei]